MRPGLQYLTRGWPCEVFPSPPSPPFSLPLLLPTPSPHTHQHHHFHHSHYYHPSPTPAHKPTQAPPPRHPPPAHTATTTTITRRPPRTTHRNHRHYHNQHRNRHVPPTSHQIAASHPHALASNTLHEGGRVRSSPPHFPHHFFVITSPLHPHPTHTSTPPLPPQPPLPPIHQPTHTSLRPRHHTRLMIVCVALPLPFL